MITRRTFAASLPLVLLTRPVLAADLIPPPYLADKFIAPEKSPAQIAIADQSEPGERLAVEGQVTDGEKPLAGVSIYVFHTDANGRYTKDGPNDDQNARLHGAMRTGPRGRFRYETIRPRGYERNPAHVHYVVRLAGYKPRMEELRFADDPAALPLPKVDMYPGYVFVVRPVTRTDDFGFVTHDIVLERE